MTRSSRRNRRSQHCIFRGIREADARGGPWHPESLRWEEGEPVELVTTLSPNGCSNGIPDDYCEDHDLWTDNILYDSPTGMYKEARMSPDGRFLLFTSYARLTSYDTAGTRQVYRFDRTDGSLSCISCATVRGQSSAESRLRLSTDEFEQNPYDLPRNMSADGQQIVFDSIDALVPEDSNGVSDVYVWRDGRLQSDLHRERPAAVDAVRRKRGRQGHLLHDRRASGSLRQRCARGSL